MRFGHKPAADRRDVDVLHLGQMRPPQIAEQRSNARVRRRGLALGVGLYSGSAFDPADRRTIRFWIDRRAADHRISWRRGNAATVTPGMIASSCRVPMNAQTCFGADGEDVSPNSVNGFQACEAATPLPNE